MSTKPTLSETISSPSSVSNKATAKPSTSTTPATTEGGSSSELAAAVDELLDQLQHKFDNVSSDIFGKLDDMTRRLDDLEAALLMEENIGAGSGGTKS